MQNVKAKTTWRVSIRISLAFGPAFVIYFHLLLNTVLDVFRAAVTFFSFNGEINFFVFCLLLFCAVLWVTMLFLFQKPVKH